MNPEDKPVVEIRFTPEFKRNLRVLAKKYRHIRSDIQPVIEALQNGDLIGDQIPRVGYTVFKVRVKNSDLQKGKSAGYRFIYYLRTAESIILITLYSKTEQSDVSAAQIRQVIKDFDS
ncbi:MAG: type II toxin-antitoxin system RelE/ParE family toxin [Chloroflexota bacterium]